MAYRYSLRDENDPLLSLLDAPGSDNAPKVSMSEESGESAPDNETSESSGVYPKDDVLTSTLLDQGRPQNYAPTQRAQPSSEMDNAWSAREKQALADSYPDQKYGLAEGLRDNGAAVLASILDIGFNHGRGLGNIVGATAQTVGAQQAQRDAKAKQAGELALKIRGKNGDDLQAQRLDYLNRSLDARVQGQGGVAERAALHRSDVNDQYSERNATAEALAYKKALAGKQGAEEGAHQYAQTTADDQGLKTTATTDANTDALRANPRAITAEEEQRNQLAREQLAATLQQRDLANAEKLKQDRIGNVSKYNKELGDAILIASNARKLQNIFDANPNDIPGVGAWDANKPDLMKSPDDIETQNLFAQFSNPQFKDIAGRAVTGSEQERVLGQVGNMKSTNEDVVRTAVKQIADTMANRIRAGSHGREDIAREVLRDHGLESLLGDAQPQDTAASAMPQQPPGSVDPLAGAQDFVPLGVSQRKPAAQAPSAPGALGPPQAVNADDWKARYEKFKIGAPQ